MSQNQSCISTDERLHKITGWNNCKIMSVDHLRDAYHTLRLTSYSKKYCGITLFYGSPTYLYLRVGMGLIISPAIWQQFIDKLFEILNIERDKIIMYHTMIFLSHQKHCEDLANLLKPLRKFGWRISPHRCQFFRDHLRYMGFTFTLKDVKPSYMPISKNSDAII